MVKKTWLMVAPAVCLVMYAGAGVLSGAEVYRARTILDLQWGDGPGQIGHTEHPPACECAYPGGPTSFDVDGHGSLYILDAVNGKVKVFREQGNLLRAFDIEGTGGELGYIALDEGGNVWIHDLPHRVFRVYTPQGVLTKSILCPPKQPLSPEFVVQEGKRTNLRDWPSRLIGLRDDVHWRNAHLSREERSMAPTVPGRFALENQSWLHV